MDNTNSLSDEILESIRNKGRITFEQFMDAALYHPEYGYYTSKKARIGKEGDYYTSSDVHRAFGVCIMRQIEEMKRILCREATSCASTPLNVVEVGAGKGLLCSDILLSAKEKSPALFNDIRYFIVEKSPDFIERQKKSVEELGLLDKVSWVPEAKEALFDGVGIILSNELIDAFPVHKVRYSNGRWNEIYVTTHNGCFVEVSGDLSCNELSAFLSTLIPNPSSLSDGYTTEVNLKSIDWIRDIGNCLNSGFVITIDYGYPRRELYSPERNRGTLMCYYRHQASEDPYVNIGEQDITAHIDFTSLAESGREAGLEITGFTDQSYFLMGCGIEEEFQKIETMGETGSSAFKNNMTLKKLLMPGGMGSIFKVLVQHKGLEKSRLRGFGFRDNSRYL